MSSYDELLAAAPDFNALVREWKRTSATYGGFSPTAPLLANCQRALTFGWNKALAEIRKLAE